MYKIEGEPRAYTLDPGVSMRVHWVEVDGVSVLVTVEAPTEKFEAFLADIEPFLASIAFAAA